MLYCNFYTTSRFQEIRSEIHFAIVARYSIAFPYHVVDASGWIIIFRMFYFVRFTLLSYEQVYAQRSQTLQSASNIFSSKEVVALVCG